MYHLLHETDQVSKAGCVCCRRNWGQKLDNLSYSRVLTPHRFFQGDPSQLSKYLDNFILNFLKGLTLPSTFYFPRQCLVSKESWHDLKASGFGWFSCCLLLSLSKCWFSGVGTCSTDFGRTSVFVTCQGTFDFKGSNMLSSLECHFSRTLFLISSWKAGMSRAACSSPDRDHGKEHLPGFPSMAAFSDSLQWPCT